MTDNSPELHINGKKKILIVDDDLQLIQNVSIYFQMEGWETISTINGIEVLELVKKHNPDIVLLDIQMPKVNGFEVLDNLKDYLHELPVLVISGLNSVDLALKAIKMGAWDYLTKPLSDVQEIEFAIYRALEKSQLLKENQKYKEHLEKAIEIRTLEIQKKNKQLEDLNKTIQEDSEKLDHKIKQRTAELENANEDLENFAFFVSHDLRASIRTIQGFSQILIEDYSRVFEDEPITYIKKINSAADRMDRIVSNLMELAIITRKELVLDDVNVSTLCTDIINELNDNNPECKAKITVEGSIIIKADIKLISLALFNLIQNACKFTQKVEKPEIIIQSFKKEGRKVISIRDNGIGIDTNEKNIVFNLLKRGKIKKEFEGNGIGLAIVKRIIEAHSGEVWAEEAISGSNF